MPTAVITFDDVVRSQLENAVPILRKHGFKATFFVCDWFCDSPIHPLKQGMFRKELHVLHEMGFELGNHTRDHADPAKLSVEENMAQVSYVEEMFREEGLPAPSVYAYPGGPFAATAAEAVKRLGYKAARTGNPQPVDMDALDLFNLPSYLLCDDHPEGFQAVVAALKEGKSVILTYHGIPDVEHPWCNVSPEHFAQQMQLLEDLGCDCPAFSEFCNRLER